jgi:hypothetical protein
MKVGHDWTFELMTRKRRWSGRAPTKPHIVHPSVLRQRRISTSLQTPAR